MQSHLLESRAALAGGYIPLAVRKRCALPDGISPFKGGIRSDNTPDRFKGYQLLQGGCGLGSGDSPFQGGNVRRLGGRGGCISQHGQVRPKTDAILRNSSYQL